jgi:hypothetical protein
MQSPEFKPQYNQKKKKKKEKTVKYNNEIHYFVQLIYIIFQVLLWLGVLSLTLGSPGDDSHFGTFLAPMGILEKTGQ